MTLLHLPGPAARSCTQRAEVGLQELHGDTGLELSGGAQQPMSSSYMWRAGVQGVLAVRHGHGAQAVAAGYQHAPDGGGRRWQRPGGLRGALYRNRRGCVHSACHWCYAIWCPYMATEGCVCAFSSMYCACQMGFSDAHIVGVHPGGVQHSGGAPEGLAAGSGGCWRRSLMSEDHARFRLLSPVALFPCASTLLPDKPR